MKHKDVLKELAKIGVTEESYLEYVAMQLSEISPEEVDAMDSFWTEIVNESGYIHEDGKYYPRALILEDDPEFIQEIKALYLMQTYWEL